MTFKNYFFVVAKIDNLEFEDRYLAFLGAHSKPLYLCLFVKMDNPRHPLFSQFSVSSLKHRLKSTRENSPKGDCFQFDMFEFKCFTTYI